MTHLILAAYALASIAGPQAAQPGIAVTYTVPPSVSLHEPIVTTLTIHNLLPETVNLDLGWDRRERFLLVVRRPDGTIQHPKIVPYGLGRRGRISIASNDHYSQQLALDDWISFDQTGDYQVTIQLPTPVTAAGTSVMRPPEDTLSIRIGPYNEAVIRAKCDQLTPSVIGDRAEEHYYALQVPRHFNDSAAVPCLRSILDRTDLADTVIFEALKSIGTADRRRVLEEIAAGSSGDRAAMARNALVTFKR
ncbi:MAG TPA: hypothetical protein VFT39_19540 [Vicinamibacterales bacterium]|nr:hypothetical protein [Vicinamibacterales bacterium]